MNIQCNGEPHTLDQPATLHDLVISLELDPQSLVAEVNGKIIEHTSFADLNLGEGDRVELIRFVGGG